ncbi:MAG: hypothetical protein IT442_15550 [Phycisphaeraceae bacterium]|nr:hypothetical protein [Phycisphaeraceae bacterium]
MKRPNRSALMHCALAASFSLSLAAPARAGSWWWQGPSVDEPVATHHSFVRDNNPAGKAIAAWDYQYATDLKNNATGASVDSIFQQCFGGGFLDNLANNGPANLTAASAARFDEVAYNKDNTGAWFDIFKKLDNFTRAYHDSMAGRSANGVQDWFGHAAFGGDGISKDPFSDPATTAGLEHPHYYTRDSLAQLNAGNGPNGTRTFAHTAGAGNSAQYAILVAWSSPNPRHGANIARIYDSLRDDFGVPADNIVVLYGDEPFGGNLPDWSGLDGRISYLPFIDGNNRRATWLSALKGEKFSTGGNVGGNIPDANDKLMIYNTGHGGQVWLRDGKWKANIKAANMVSADGGFDLIADGVGLAYDPNTEEAMSIMNDPLGTGSMLIQFLLRQQINSDASFDLLGVGSFSAGGSFVIDPSQIYNYNGPLDEPLYAYQFSVDYQTLRAAAGALEIDISNLQSPYLVDNLVAAFSVIGGDQETAWLDVAVIPEPSMLGMLVLGGLTMLRRR